MPTNIANAPFPIAAPPGLSGTGFPGIGTKIEFGFTTGKEPGIGKTFARGRGFVGEGFGSLVWLEGSRPANRPISLHECESLIFLRNGA
jgi:hypothetical protein